MPDQKAICQSGQHRWHNVRGKDCRMKRVCKTCGEFYGYLKPPEPAKEK